MKRLVLLGGGHAHLRVLAELGKRPLSGWEVLLVTPQPRQIYSGMLPGWVAGHYPLDACAIDLRPLAERAGVRLVLDAATGLDLRGRRVCTRQASDTDFDALSIDVGSARAVEAIEGAAEHAVFVRPIEAFVDAWPRLEEQVRRSCRPFHAVILGAGAGGLELALALRHRAQCEGWSHLHVHLVGGGPLPLPGAPASAQARVMKLLRQRCIPWHANRRATALRAGGVEFEEGEPLPCDVCWAVTGSAAPPWLGASDLATDEGGFVRVGATLQSVSHEYVFAAGDASSHAAGLPKSGVYAVRAGAALAHNLVAYCQGTPLLPWRPQSRALYLISAGDRRAVAIWGRWSWQGRWVWRWKDGIDRRFVRSYSR